MPRSKLAFGRWALNGAGWGASAILIGGLSQGVAAPLDKASCDKLTETVQNLKALDVEKLMEKGPSWAVAHLSQADLNLIRQYIDLDEQLKFRCSAPSSLVHLKHLDDEDEDAAKDAEAVAPGASPDADATAKTKKVAKGAKKAKPASPPDSGDRN